MSVVLPTSSQQRTASVVRPGIQHSEAITSGAARESGLRRRR
jgi:hypothetical protein